MFWARFRPILVKKLFKVFAISNVFVISLAFIFPSAAGDCTFVHAAATVWNALPVSVTSKDSLLSFKSALKTHLCALAYA